MKIFSTLFLAILVVGVMALASPGGNEIDKDLTKQISDILKESGKIAPGTTRAELLKIFTTEGGLSTAKSRTYVHRRCPYIKVNVEFTLSDAKQSVVEERPTDTISKISNLYLGWSIVD
jgi:hypothetical protein